MSGGKVVVEVPADWPDGTEVRVAPVGPEDELPDDEDGSPEAIAKRLALMDRVEGGWLTPDEYAAWTRQLAEDRTRDKAHWDADNAAARRVFE